MNIQKSESKQDEEEQYKSIEENKHNSPGPKRVGVLGEFSSSNSSSIAIKPSGRISPSSL